MHARDLVELAAVAASLGPARIESRKCFGDVGLLEYWSAAKCRFERWMRALRAAPDPGSPGSDARLQAVLEEILASEMLTRVWTAIGCACDQAAGVDEAGPVLLNVWAAHLQARYRALTFLVAGSGVRLEQVIAVNRVRRLSERWTDLLLGQLADVCPVGRFSHSLRRVHQFGRDAKDNREPEVAWAVLNASLRVSMRVALTGAAANPDLNQQLAGGVLANLPSELFASTGVPKDFWVVRMERTSTDARVLVDKLIAADAVPSTGCRIGALRRGRRS